MSAVHPSFRRLLAVGAVPAVASARLARPLALLAALARELAPLAGVRAGALLRTLDLSAALDVAGRRTGDESAAGQPSAASDAAMNVANPRTMRAPRSGERRPRSTAAAEGRIAPAASASHVCRQHDARAVAELLDRHAPRDVFSSGASETGHRKPTDPTLSTRGAARPRGTATPHASAVRAGRIATTSAQTWLATRAARAGVPEAADLRVVLSPTSDTERLLAVVTRKPDAPELTTKPASGDDAPTGPSAPAALARTLGRLDSATRSAAGRGPRRAQERVVELRPSGDARQLLPTAGGARPTRATVGNVADGATLSGLRGLAARLTGAAQTTGASNAASAPAAPSLPDVVAERMRETDLGDRLAALLRREAHRAGIDVGGVGP